MAKNTLADFDTTAANNTDVLGQGTTGAAAVSTIDSMIQNLMGVLARFYADFGGTGTVGGSANAVTLTTASTYQALATGVVVTLKAASANTGAATLNVDGLGAKAIRLSGDTALSGSEMLANGIYTLRYDASYASAAGAWVLLNPETSRTTLGLATSSSPQFSAIELGDASDTTVSRGAAGFVAVEGKRVPSPASQASGDLLYRGSTEWERLAKGTALQALRMNSGATAPEWAAPAGMLLLTSGTVSNAATLDIVLTSYTGYKGLAVQLFNFLPATNNASLYLRTSTNGGVSYDSGASDYGYVMYNQNSNGISSLNTEKSTGAAQIDICDELSNSATLGGITVMLTIWDQTASKWGKFSWNGVFGMQAGSFVGANWGGGARQTGADIDAVRILMSTGNITSGGYAVYGYV